MVIIELPRLITECIECREKDWFITKADHIDTSKKLWTNQISTGSGLNVRIKVKRKLLFKIVYSCRCPLLLPNYNNATNNTIKASSLAIYHLSAFIFLFHITYFLMQVFLISIPLHHDKNKIDSWHIFPPINNTLIGINSCNFHVSGMKNYDDERSNMKL